MSHRDWKDALAPKVAGSWILHQVLQDAPIDFFVVFSSVVGLGGNAGQANYAAANTFLDALVSHRQSMGLPASVLNLGVMDGVGVLARDAKLLDWSRAGCMRLLSESEMLEGLEVVLRHSRDFEKDQSTGLLNPPLFPIGFSSTKPLVDVGVRPLWSRDSRFRTYANIESSTDHTTQSNIDAIKELLLQVEADPTILDKTSSEDIIKKELIHLIGSHIPHAEGYTQEEWSDIAIDSLMTIEIRNWFRRNLGLEVSVIDITNAGTVGGLSKVTIKALRDKYNPEPGVAPS